MNANRLITWKTFDRKRWQFEKIAIREFRRALLETVRPVTGADSVEQALNRVDNLSDEAIAKAYANVYGQVGSYFAVQSQNQLKRLGATFETKSTDTVFDQFMRNWIALNGAERVKGVLETTIRRLKVKLQDGINAGDGIDKIAREIVRSGSGIADVARARVIARTEIISASNLGSLQGAKDTGIPLRKEWLSTQDNRTRSFEKGDQFDHVIVDGQKVLLDQEFNINGEAMQFPGDWTNGASAGNTILCRCTQVYVPLASQSVSSSPITAEEYAPLPNLSYTGNKTIIDKYKRDIDSVVRELGIKKQLNVVFSDPKDGAAGYVGWVKKPDGNFTLGPNVIISTDEGDNILKVARHELRHQWQSEQDRFSAKSDGYYYWNGERYISFNTYRNITRQARMSLAGLKKYRALPWETDADDFAGITYDPRTGQMKSQNFDIIDLIPLPPGGDEIADQQDEQLETDV